MFSYLAAYCTRHTTEAYLPIIICCLLQYKVFEVPPWLNDLYVRCNAAYTLLICRSHMGQEIFHGSLSVMHAFSKTSIQYIRAAAAKLEIDQSIARHVIHTSSSLVTSNNVAIIESFTVATPDYISMVTTAGVLKCKKVHLLTIDTMQEIKSKIELSMLDYDALFNINEPSIDIDYIPYDIESNNISDIIIADSSSAITKAFEEVFIMEKKIYCFFIIIKTITKHTSLCAIPKCDRMELRRDINFLQISSSVDIYNVAKNLFLTKWNQYTQFCQYFIKQWICKSWYEGAVLHIPSINNSLVATNGVIKRQMTLREHIPLNQFFSVICKDILSIWSLDRKQYLQYSSNSKLETKE
ncbi:hypothetical protein A3Q56_06061 [Intoshia linei]|uniref:Uncharacterized protein n=1 Tax=Intoshia linei TaxID=1819745 RepID=A0A177AW62_9BILA|nr:hypothetical protein A3Q56_06061 [Intoshia linei]